MAWTSPLTWAVSQVVTAAQLNVHLRDNLLETMVAKVTTAGDMAYATGANALTRLGIGANNKHLGVVAGVPAWVDPIEKVGVARSSGALTLTTTMADIPGATITVTAGTWLVFGGVEFAKDITGDANIALSAQLLANGVAQAGQLRAQSIGPSPELVSGVWNYTAAGSEVLKLQAMKNAGTGGTITPSVNCYIVAIRTA